MISTVLAHNTARSHCLWNNTEHSNPHFLISDFVAAVLTPRIWYKFRLSWNAFRSGVHDENSRQAPASQETEAGARNSRRRELDPAEANCLKSQRIMSACYIQFNALIEAVVIVLRDWRRVYINAYCTDLSNSPGSWYQGIAVMSQITYLDPFLLRPAISIPKVSKSKSTLLITIAHPGTKRQWQR